MVPAPLCYQWYAGGTKIKKATTSTLTLTSKQKNKKITVKVTATDGSDVSRSLSMVKRRKACPDAAPSDPELC